MEEYAQRNSEMNEESTHDDSNNAQPEGEDMHDENKKTHYDEHMDEPAHKSRTLPWTAGNLPPDADLTMVGSMVKLGVSEQVAR